MWHLTIYPLGGPVTQSRFRRQRTSDCAALTFQRQKFLRNILFIHVRSTSDAIGQLADAIAGPRRFILPAKLSLLSPTQNPVSEILPSPFLSTE
ncbi:hypothetical protein SDJN02_25952, partial [Cucurbita argyrosperma subsp. argyrosperma]